MNFLKWIWEFLIELTADETWKPTVATNPPTPIYLWDTPQQALHSIRLICDEEGLTLEQKDTLCATIHCESQFNTKAINVNYMMKNGEKVVASTDNGICQWNDFYHAKEISPDDALNNPEKAVRLMCKYWKEGLRSQWVCYLKGAYKQYL
jgi:hypothetical protein